MTRGYVEALRGDYLSSHSAEHTGYKNQSTAQFPSVQLSASDYTAAYAACRWLDNTQLHCSDDPQILAKCSVCVGLERKLGLDTGTGGFHTL